MSASRAAARWAGAALLVAAPATAVGVDLGRGAAARDEVAARLGPVDARIVTVGSEHLTRDLAHVEDLIRHTTVAGTDGLLTLTTADATFSSAGENRIEERRGCVADVDFAAVRNFGPDPAIGGMADAGSRPAAGEIVIGTDAARRLRVDIGDRLDVTVAGVTTPLRVTALLTPRGVAGYCDGFVSSGFVASALSASNGRTARGELLVSARGGVADGPSRGEALAAELRGVLDDAEADASTAASTVVTEVDAPASAVFAAHDRRRSEARPLTATLAAAVALVGAASVRAGRARRRPADPPSSPRRRRGTA